MKKQEQQTQTGELHDSVGFPGFKEEGYAQPLEEQLKAMEANGFDVDKTDKGILITVKTN
jgi:hypothetical protein